MLQWTLYSGIPFTLVATKADKISKSQRNVAANKAAKQMGAPPFAIPFSAEEKIGSEALLTRIGQIVEDAKATAERQTSAEVLETVFTAESPE